MDEIKRQYVNKVGWFIKNVCITNIHTCTKIKTGKVFSSL